jgi:hypothetical protein
MAERYSPTLQQRDADIQIQPAALSDTLYLKQKA